MIVSEFIKNLEKVRDQYGGNLPIYVYYDGLEKYPHIEVVAVKFILDTQTFDMQEQPAETRALIR